MAAESRSNAESMRVVRPQAREMLLSELSRMYTTFQATAASESHAKRERWALDSLMRELGDIDTSSIDEPLIAAYRRKRQQDERSTTTINKETGILKRALEWARSSGYIRSHGLVDLKPLAVSRRDLKKKRRAFSDEELDIFIGASRRYDTEASCRKARKQIIPQTPLWVTFLGCGARRGELLAVRWRHVQLDIPAADPSLKGMGELRLVKTKSDIERSVPLAPDAAKEIARLFRVQEEAFGRPPKPSDYVFLTPMGKPWNSANSRNALRSFDRLLGLAEIPKEVDGRTLDVHSCRMTYNTRMARAGVELGERQHLLGHSSPQMTESMYTDRGSVDHHGALARMVSRERGLRRQFEALGCSEEEIESAMVALGLGSASPSASLEVVESQAGDQSRFQSGTAADNQMESGIGLEGFADGGYGQAAIVDDHGSAHFVNTGSSNWVPADWQWSTWSNLDHVKNDRCLREAEVEGSNPFAPTIFSTAKTVVDGSGAAQAAGVEARPPLIIHSDALAPGQTLSIVLIGLPQSADASQPEEDSDDNSRSDRGPDLHP